MFRYIRVLLIALAVAVPALIGAAFVQEIWKQRAEDKKYFRYSNSKAKANPGAPKPRPTEPPLPPAIEPAEVARIIANGRPRYPKGIKEDYSWQQIEAILARLRSERPERPQAIDDLESWYNFLAHPIFTASEDIAEHIAKMEAWRRELPDSATALVVLAQIQINYAWEARGIGLAFTVTPEGWKLFSERIAVANDLLREAIEKGVKDGQPFALMLTVAKADGWPRSKADDAVAAGQKIDPSYAPLYTAMAEYLLPRWHGEPGDIEQFAAEVVENVPGDDGLDAYGQIAYRIHYYEPELLYYGGYNHRLLAKAAEVLARRYPYARNLVPFAALSTIAAQDHQAARRVQPFIRNAEAPRLKEWSNAARQFEDWCQTREIPSDDCDWIWATHGGDGGIAFDADSQFIWCGRSRDYHSVVKLDLKNKAIVEKLSGQGGGVQSLIVDTERRSLAVIVQNTEFSGWVLWDLDDPLEPFTRECEQPQRLALSSRTGQFAVSSMSDVRTYDIATLEEGPVIPTGHAYALRYSPDGEVLAINSTAWDTKTGEKLYQVSGQNIQEFDLERRPLVFSSVHSQAGSQTSLKRFSRTGSDPETLISNMGQHTFTTALSPDGKLLAVSDGELHKKGEKISVWNLSTGKLHKQFGGHWDHIGSMAFSADGTKLASIARMGGIIKIWKISDKPTVDRPL